MAEPALRRALAAAAAVFLLNVILLWPVYLPGELPYRDSIEAGYASMAHFLRHNPSPWGWNPLVYAGLPSQHMYLPVLPYAAAGMNALIGSISVEYAHRLIVTLATLLQPAAIFLLAWYFSRHRGWALLAALGYTLISPSYGLFPAVDHDRGLMQLPWHAQVLIKYGEGPHNTGLALLPLAALALWRAAARRTFRRVALAAVLLAAITLVNWVAALALAWAAAMLLLAWWQPRGTDWRRHATLLLAALLAYGLALFWLTPGYIGTILGGWSTDSFNYKLLVQQRWLLAGLCGGTLALRALFLLLPRHEQLCWLALCLFGTLYPPLVWYRWAVDVIPESRRYALPFEMFFWLLAAALAQLVWRQQRRWLRYAGLAAACGALALGLPQAWRFVTKPAARLRPVPAAQTVEYTLAERLNQLQPAGRILASGGLRYHLNQWHALAQLGGTFETGLRSRRAWNVNWHIRTGTDSQPGQWAADAVRELQATGVEYVVIHGKGSREHYQDYRNPRLFEGVLEHVADLGADDIYRVPFHGFAHLVRPAELPGGWTFAWLPPYVGAIEDTGRPRLQYRWRGPSAAEIEGPLPAGMLVSVQVNDDPGWRAYQDGVQIPTARDAFGFLVLHPRPAESSTIRLSYGAPLSVRFCALLSIAVWVWMLLRVWRERRAA